MYVQFGRGAYNEMAVFPKTFCLLSNINLAIDNDMVIFKNLMYIAVS